MKKIIIGLFFVFMVGLAYLTRQLVVGFKIKDSVEYIVEDLQKVSIPEAQKMGWVITNPEYDLVYRVEKHSQVKLTKKSLGWTREVTPLDSVLKASIN